MYEAAAKAQIDETNTLDSLIARLVTALTIQGLKHEGMK